MPEADQLQTRALFDSRVFAEAGRGMYLEGSNIWGKGNRRQKKYYRCIRVIKQTPTDQRAQGKGCELIWQRQAEVVMRAGTKGQGGHLWKVYYLQILGFPLMGNFTTISWGLVQIKTNGDPDSWLRSGYCKTQTHTQNRVRPTAMGVKRARRSGAEKFKRWVIARL